MICDTLAFPLILVLRLPVLIVLKNGNFAAARIISNGYSVIRNTCELMVCFILRYGHMVAVEWQKLIRRNTTDGRMAASFVS